MNHPKWTTSYKKWPYTKNVDRKPKIKNLWKTLGDLEPLKNLPQNLRGFCFFDILKTLYPIVYYTIYIVWKKRRKNVKKN